MKKQLFLLVATLAVFALSFTAVAAEAEPEAGYGFPGTYDDAAADNECLTIFEGTEIFDGVMKNCHQETAFQNSDNSVMIINNSFVKDSVLPIVTTDTAKCYIVGSTVESTSGGAIFDGLAVAPEEGELPLTTYLFGSKVNALNTGAGFYNELLCDAYIFGSYVTGSAIGIQSETYGNITIGSLEDGKANAEMAGVLADLNVTAEEDMKSIIESGKNAIILNSSNNPDFTEMDGCSLEILAGMSAKLSVANSELRTVKFTQSGMRFQSAANPYTDHCQGSVILIKSTNADISIDGSVVDSYKHGTGNVIHSVLNDDDEYIMAVADGEEAPGIQVKVNASELNGNIAHEDYQRKMNVELSAVTWTGSAYEGSVDQWNAKAEEEGFEELIYDEAYTTHNGLGISLTGNSTWNVTAESCLSCLMVEEGSVVNASVTVNGEAVELVPGEVYEGEIVLVPVE